MGTDLIVPEITLIEKLEEVNSSLPPVIWQQMRNEVAVYDEKDKNLPATSRTKKRMLLSDFVNKAINLPLEIAPKVSPEVEKQLYRLHLFCCQQAVHNPEVRRNPLLLGFRALEEMHMALVALFTSYRLIHPDCPYSWTRDVFEGLILTHKGADGHTIVTFHRPLTEDIINAAISEDIITDWLIYRAVDHNGIRTLMDIKNNLIDLPNFQRGGNPEAEFSRFERKMQEKRNRKKEKQDDALELEFRKKLVETVAGKAVEQMLASGMSPMDLLNQAFNGDISALVNQNSTATPVPVAEKKHNKKNKALPKPQKDTTEIEHLISELLDNNS